MRCIRRVNRLGLAGAVIEGILSSSADFVAVIDGDLQHDETILPKMYEALIAAAPIWRSAPAISEDGRRARPVAGAAEAERRSAHGSSSAFRGRAVSDPMSGFFMIRRDRRSVAPRLSSDGFKILADILSARPKLRIVETSLCLSQARAPANRSSRLWSAMDFLGPRRPSRERRPAADPIRAVLAGRRVRPDRAYRCALWLSTLGGRRRVLTRGSFSRPSLRWGAIFCSTMRSLTGTIAFAVLGCFAASVAFALGCSVGVLANIDIASALYRSHQVWWLAGSREPC